MADFTYEEILYLRDLVEIRSNRVGDVDEFRKLKVLLDKLCQLISDLTH